MPLRALGIEVQANLFPSQRYCVKDTEVNKLFAGKEGSIARASKKDLEKREPSL